MICERAGRQCVHASTEQPSIPIPRHAGLLIRESRKSKIQLWVLLAMKSIEIGAFCLLLVAKGSSEEFENMNLLKHKSWHVYGKDNVEKVRKDEAKANEAEKQSTERSAVADKERRLALLRQRAQEKRSENNGRHDDSEEKAQDHVNLFEEEETQRKALGANAERQADAKAAKNKIDRQLAMHLDTGVKESRNPWYAQNSSSKSEKTTQDLRDDDRKRRQDPLTDIRRRLDHEKTSTVKSKSKRLLSFDDEDGQDVAKSKQRTKPTIEQMRQARLERELEARQRREKMF